MSIVSKQTSAQPQKEREKTPKPAPQKHEQPMVQNSVLNLFGIRKPVSVLQDTDFKSRLMLEEMIQAQNLDLDPKPKAVDEEQSANDEQVNLYFDDLDSSAPAGKPAISHPLTKIDYSVKIFFPKKFEVLRKFYCGSHLNFIESMISSSDWLGNNGGKTLSSFQTTFDKKYVMKEVKKSELRMFLEFAPQYFDYLGKAFFHDYPCTLAKIVGVYKVKIAKKKEAACS